jgi:peptidoglycan/xylan/chitin deacetylase (PgdA/CDA1 family)
VSRGELTLFIGGPFCMFAATSMPCRPRFSRRFLTLFLLTLLPLAGCKKRESPAQAEQRADTAAREQAAVAPTATPEPTPVPPPIDNKAQVVVLCYHRLEGKAGGALSIEPEEFERQMQAIKDAGLAVISMNDFLAWRRGEKSIPPKSVLITIDDGYVSSYDVGWPILKKYGYPFTMFVYLNYISKGGKSVSWEQLAEMRDAGVDIQSHTVSHQDLRRKGKGAKDYDTWLKDELERSKQEIEARLGIKVTALAYPFGLHNDKVHKAGLEAGYEAMFSTYGQRLTRTAPAYALGRYDVTTKDAQGRSSFEVAIGFQGMLAEGGADSVMGQDAAVSMVTQPMNNETISDLQPTLKANLATMGDVDAKSIQMRVSGIGPVPATYDAATKMLTYKVAQDLKPGSYTVIISAVVGGRKVETRWSFQVDPAAKPGSAEPSGTVPIGS